MFIVSFDLDNTIINVNPLVKKAFKDAGEKYTKPTIYNWNNIYSKNVCDKLKELFSSDMIYDMNLIESNIPYYLNLIYNHSNFNPYYVTQRFTNNQEKTYKQLSRLEIKTNIENVIDHSVPKIEILKNIRSELHFDDNPHVIEDCLNNNIRCHMISNNDTLYNHYLREHVKHSEKLSIGLLKENLIFKSK